MVEGEARWWWHGSRATNEGRGAHSCASRAYSGFMSKFGKKLFPQERSFIVDLVTAVTARINQAWEITSSAQARLAEMQRNCKEEAER